MKRFIAWICETFGHSFAPVDQIMFEIKRDAVNRDVAATIRCRRCKQEFSHKDA